MNLPLEIQEQIFCNSIETLIISQFLNTQIRKLTYNKFSKLDRNLLLTKFTRSGQNFKANKDLIVIHIPVNYILINFKYEKRLTNDCFLITFNEYLTFIDKDYNKLLTDNQSTLGRALYVYGRKITSQVYINPCKMIVKKIGGRHENFILTKDKSLKDINDSKDYLEVNFIIVFDYKFDDSIDLIY